jgi:hypothetical protein
MIFLATKFLALRSAEVTTTGDQEYASEIPARSQGPTDTPVQMTSEGQIREALGRS